MKVSTKNKILDLLNENLRSARQKKSVALSKLRSCEENIRWGKKGTAKNDQTLSNVQSIIKDDHSHMNSVILDAVKGQVKNNAKQLQKDRSALVSIRNEMSVAKREIQKWSGLINEVSPYKKQELK